MARGKKVSLDLRWTVIRMLKTLSINEISSYTGLSDSKIKAIKSVYRKTGDVVEGQERKRSMRSLRTEHVDLLLGCLDMSCDYYLDELQKALHDGYGVNTSQATIWRALRDSGYSMKKMTRIAVERSAQKRAAYTAQIGQYRPDQLIFVDESAADRRTTYRGRAWAVRGHQAERKAYFIRGKRYSILPALSLDGILFVKILEGSFNSDAFAVFINHLLNQMHPYPGRNSVIVMDNCKIHKRRDILRMIEERGMRYEFLPPYSPDLNPIEEAFSAIKAHLRRHGHSSRTAMVSNDDTQVYARLHEAVWSVSAMDALGWYRHSGYL